MYEIDPFKEEKFSPVPGLIHKYSSRALIVVTNRCAGYCAFCMRKWLVNENKFAVNAQQILQIKKYLLKHKKINEVIFSGGDPLMVPGQLKEAVKTLGSLPQVKVLRVHTRLPVSAPEMINKKLISVLAERKDKPLYVVVHFDRVKEVSAKTISAIKKLQTVCTMVLSHTVLLRGVNDSPQELGDLFTKLVTIGVKPYCLFHCDPVRGNEKFVVDLKKEIKIVSELRRQLSGLAFPIFTIEAPSSSGKVPVPLDFWDFNCRYFRDFKGKKIKTA